MNQFHTLEEPFHCTECHQQGKAAEIKDFASWLHHTRDVHGCDGSTGRALTSPNTTLLLPKDNRENDTRSKVEESRDSDEMGTTNSEDSRLGGETYAMKHSENIRQPYIQQKRKYIEESDDDTQSDSEGNMVDAGILGPRRSERLKRVRES